MTFHTSLVSRDWPQTKELSLSWSLFFVFTSLCAKVNVSLKTLSDIFTAVSCFCLNTFISKDSYQQVLLRYLRQLCFPWHMSLLSLKKQSIIVYFYSLYISSSNFMLLLMVYHKINLNSGFGSILVTLINWSTRNYYILFFRINTSFKKKLLCSHCTGFMFQYKVMLSFKQAINNAVQWKICNN